MNEEQFNIVLEILSGLYIQSLRNYDILCVIGDKLGADVVELKNLHERGYVLAPDPALRIEESDEDPPSDDD